LLDEALFPIVYVDLWPIKGGLSGQYHSLVVVAVERERVIVLDPLVGERHISREDFQTAWEEMRLLAIVISN
jgi:ABC-type bacteriocin/lantibiotic exporter with double-glycine peptidase domain